MTVVFLESRGSRTAATKGRKTRSPRRTLLAQSSRETHNGTPLKPRSGPVSACDSIAPGTLHRADDHSKLTKRAFLACAEERHYICAHLGAFAELIVYTGLIEFDPVEFCSAIDDAIVGFGIPNGRARFVPARVPVEMFSR